ncbi:MAG: CoA activase [Fusobacteriaceae bacterium]|nr:CoA activase [Fusobacteriaceae bacterium]MBP9510161.1 CoA activase [Fusobacteriaceae bacterium]
MVKIGIDVGSTATKVAILNNDILEKYFIVPSGWSSVQTSLDIKKRLENEGYDLSKCKIVATGYGRVSVPFAHKTLTEITCHTKGVEYISKISDITIIDVGGQDTKVIEMCKGSVNNFLMNDKCSAGTGRFIEVMSNSMGVHLDELYELAMKGEEVAISSMCTVFAESEVISFIGSGAKKEDIANGVISSVIKKVAGLVSRLPKSDVYFLSGGLCESDYFIEQLSKELKTEVLSHNLARYAGAIGAACLAK